MDLEGIRSLILPAACSIELRARRSQAKRSRWPDLLTQNATADSLQSTLWSLDKATTSTRNARRKYDATPWHQQRSDHAVVRGSKGLGLNGDLGVYPIGSLKAMLALTLLQVNWTKKKEKRRWKIAGQIST